MNIKESVLRWLTNTKPRYSFVVETEIERSEPLRVWEAPSEEDIKRSVPDDPWRPKSTLGPL